MGLCGLFVCKRNRPMLMRHHLRQQQQQRQLNRGIRRAPSRRRSIEFRLDVFTVVVAFLTWFVVLDVAMIDIAKVSRFHVVLQGL